MIVRKALSLAGLLLLVAAAACSDVTGPKTENFCDIGGGPGTSCVTSNQTGR
jgi:hypothetical protein